MTAVLVVVIASAVVFRVDMVRLWPQTAGAYAAVELPVNHVCLVIEQLKAEPSLQDGHAALTISGVLRNIENQPVETPPLQLSLLNPAGKRVAGKVAAAADPLVSPDDTRHFAIAILDRPSTAKDFEISFVLDDGAAKAVKAAVPYAAAKSALRGSAKPAPVPSAHVIEAKPLPHDVVRPVSRSHP